MKIAEIRELATADLTERIETEVANYNNMKSKVEKKVNPDVVVKKS